MKTIVDFHIHSKYSRATSKYLDLIEIAKWSKIKGVDIVSGGDFTHPRWLEGIKSQLTEDGSGLLTMKGNTAVKFILATEVACIYRHKDATRRVHHIILAPTIPAVEKINQSLISHGCKLASDGRPILGLSSKDLLQLVLDADPRAAIIPAHVWTPWFAIFGSKSGYDSVEDCFEDLTPNIFALETGLSSDPEMNWSLSALDRYTLISNSDAHSGPKIGREANVFDLAEPTYDEILRILRTKDQKKFLYTIEFFPEEGMYHYDGHRLCRASFEPSETKRLKNICPVCHKPLTIGVLHRVDNLRDRELGSRPTSAVPFRKIVPLPEVIADFLGVAAGSRKVEVMYETILAGRFSEFSILLDLDLQQLKSIMPEPLADGILSMRQGQVKVIPGFDGNYGTVSLFSDQQRRQKTLQRKLL